LELAEGLGLGADADVFIPGAVAAFNLSIIGGTVGAIDQGGNPQADQPQQQGARPFQTTAPDQDRVTVELKLVRQAPLTKDRPQVVLDLSKGQFDFVGLGLGVGVQQGSQGSTG
jgi:hypothetical protein